MDTPGWQHFLEAGFKSEPLTGHVCARQALLVQLVQQPQDGSADTAVRLALAPSYVTYLPAAVERVLDFFRTEQVRELEQLRGCVAVTHPL